MARYVKTGTVTGIPALNAELEKIENSFKEMFSRVGELPNQVESDMDMNGNSILNVKVDPANPNSLVSRSDVYLNYEVDAKDQEILRQAKEFASGLGTIESREMSTTLTLVNGTPPENVNPGDIVKVEGYTNPLDGGACYWVASATTGLTPSQTPKSREDWFLVDSEGRLWEFFPINPRMASPKVFGTANDGVTSDDVPTQILIDYFASIGGGIVHLDAPSWALEGVEILNDNIAIIGLGRYGTDIKYIGNPAVTNTVAAISIGQSKTGSGALIPVRGCLLSGFTIDGNRAGGSVGGGIRVTVFEGLEIRDVEVKDCFENYGFGIVGTGSTPRKGIVLYNCAAYRCGADGLDIKAGLVKALIVNFESAGHYDETGGDSVGLDLRGQYITVVCPEIYDCIEFGVRVRINAGEEDGDGNWDTTESPRVLIVNPVLYNNRDNIALNSTAKGVVTCINPVSRNATRYGITVDGTGEVNIIGGSASENLTGILAGASSNLTMTSVSIKDNTQDGISGGSCEKLKLIGCNIEGNARYGLSQSGTSATASWRIIGSDIRGNLTNYVNLSAFSDGDVSFTDSTITLATSRGIQVTEAPMLLRFTGGSVTGNATNIHSVNNNSFFSGVRGATTRARGQTSFAVDSIGKKTISITHGLGFTPSVSDVSMSLARSTVVDDYVIDWVRVAGASSTVFTVEVNVSTASASAGAEAFVIWKADVKTYTG